MEIIYKSNAKMSNFNYCSNIFKDKTPINGFNKVPELMCEPIGSNRYISKNVSFDSEINGNLYLCYPLQVVTKENIRFSSLHELIEEIRKSYREIYKNPIKYGIWGHDIGELVIESITVYNDYSIQVSIGS